MPQYLPFVRKYFNFYTQLNLKDKEIFEKRVQLFIDNKKFISRGGLTKVTPEMKALVAGTA